MPVKLAALPIASGGSVPASTLIVRVRVLFFSEMREQSNGGRGREFGQIRLFHRADSLSFTSRLRCA